MNESPGAEFADAASRTLFYAIHAVLAFEAWHQHEPWKDVHPVEVPMPYVKRLAQTLAILPLLFACKPGDTSQDESSPRVEEQTEATEQALEAAETLRRMEFPPGPLHDYVYDDSAPQLATERCVFCHVAPASADHRKADWPVVMARMAYWMGMSDEDVAKIEPHVPAAEFARIIPTRNELIELGQIPPTPLIDFDSWKAVLDAYVGDAPKVLAQPAANIEYSSWPDASVETLGEDRLTGFLLSAVFVDEQNGKLLVAEAKYGANGLESVLHEWGPSDGFRRTLESENVITAIEPHGDNLLVTLIGDLSPANDANGELLRVRYNQAGEFEAESIIGGLLRTPHALPVDDDTILVSSFGHRHGRLGLVRRNENGWHEAEVLVDSPGASESVAISDENETSYLTLFGQALDGVARTSLNEDGEWVTEMAIVRSPAFGHSDFSVVDIDQDGDEDILVANGDNLDLPDNPPRPYHGVRVYENDGRNGFEETFFFPLNGAYGVTAGNFDRDDELEIAAVAYFLQPDVADQRFVLLDRAQGAWRPYTVSLPDQGRFFRIEAADLDRSGMDEIYLGAGYRERVGPEAPRLIQVSFD